MIYVNGTKNDVISEKQMLDAGLVFFVAGYPNHGTKGGRSKKAKQGVAK